MLCNYRLLTDFGLVGTFQVLVDRSYRGCAPTSVGTRNFLSQGWTINPMTAPAFADLLVHNLISSFDAMSTFKVFTKAFGVSDWRFVASFFRVALVE